MPEHITPARRRLLAALRDKGRSKPIDAYEHANGPVDPGSRGGVATATMRELRDLMALGYVNAVYSEVQPERGITFDATAAGLAQAGHGNPAPAPPPRPPIPPGPFRPADPDSVNTPRRER